MQDKTEIYKLLKRSATQGDAKAQCKIGLCYINGDGVEKDLKKAFLWFEKSANQGNADAMKNLADCYDKGNGVGCDIIKAYRLYKESAVRGNLDALCNLIDPLYKSDDNHEYAVRYAKYGAEKGNAKAQERLAYFYEYSNLLEKDLKVAFYWYEKSATQGYKPAQIALGDCYAKGKGTNEDLQKALYWYKKSAVCGSEYGYGEQRLADFYEKGIGVKQNLKVAEKWFIKAFLQDREHAIKGESPNLIKLIEFYERNIETLATIKSFHKNILDWTKLGVKHNFGCATYLLARLYENGFVLNKSNKKAVLWYKKSLKTYYCIKAKNALEHLKKSFIKK